VKSIALGWVTTPLSQVVAPKSDRVDPRTLPQAEYIGLEHVEAHTQRILGTLPSSAVSSSSARFEAGDVLYGRMRPYLNKVAMPSFDGIASAEFIVFPPSDAICSRFLAARIGASDFVEFACSQYEGDRPRVKFEQLARWPIDLPPRAEQTRIVTKLEELLSALDTGVAELKAAQKKLAQYRQSLLKAAVSGELSAAWREKNPPKETGQLLLQRILRERRSRWETTQLAKFKAQGKAPPKGWKEKYVEPVQPDVSELPQLPEGWGWASVDQMAEIGTGVTPLRSNREYFDNGTIPWVTSGALNEDFVYVATENVTSVAMEKCRLELYPVGTLLVAMYGEGKTRGKCSELKIAATINQAIAALVLHDTSDLCRAYVKVFLLGSYEAMRGHASGGVQPNLNLQIVRSLALPLPPSKEQEQICYVLEQQMAGIEEQKDLITRLLKQSTAQRKNILQAAFSGQLVPQDPADEPASALLARIRAARGVVKAPNKAAKPARKSRSAA
jgi:type I restriction enzyme, S subunit